MSDPHNPTLRCTGIFIPIEILEMEELSTTEMMLLSTIDALFCPKHGGCYASDEYLAKRMKVKKNTIEKALIKFRKLKLVVTIRCNGRTRIMRALIAKHVNHHQSGSEPEKNQVQNLKKIQSSRPRSLPGKNSPDIKAERKEKTEQEPACSSASLPVEDKEKRKRYREVLQKAGCEKDTITQFLNTYSLKALEITMTWWSKMPDSQFNKIEFPWKYFHSRLKANHEKLEDKDQS
jgi:hypothetical protein